MHQQSFLLLLLKIYPPSVMLHVNHVYMYIQSIIYTVDCIYNVNYVCVYINYISHLHMTWTLLLKFWSIQQLLHHICLCGYVCRLGNKGFVFSQPHVYAYGVGNGISCQDLQKYVNLENSFIKSLLNTYLQISIFPPKWLLNKDCRDKL